LLAELTSAVQAVENAVAVQRACEARNRGVPAEKQLRFRIGINLGDVIADGDDIFGDGVNIAARLEGVAEPGGISVSARVALGTSQCRLGKFDIGMENMRKQTGQRRL
jgi:adenylate cyclase